VASVSGDSSAVSSQCRSPTAMQCAMKAQDIACETRSIGNILVVK
jgi:hypothetical protein